MALRANKIAVLGDLHGKWNPLDNEYFDRADYELLIFVGALGGLLNAGIIGLFIGPVILALGYELFLAWIRRPDRVPQG